MTTALLDTSMFIATEQQRRIDHRSLPDSVAVSAITIGELRWGVLMATDDEARARRLDTLSTAERLDPVPVDHRVAAAWALLRQRLLTARMRMEINDSWIAATAIAYGWAVATQDRGFPDGIPDLVVIQV